jgi:hypothetical protein
MDRRKQPADRFYSAVLLTLSALLVLQPALRAATITVTGTADVLSSDGTCSLREAVTNANDDAAIYGDCAAGTGADTIVIPAGTFSLTLTDWEDWWVGDNTIGDLDLSDPDLTTLSGSGAAVTILDGVDSSRILHVLEGAFAALHGVTVQNGRERTGGGIFNQGTSSVSHSVISGNAQVYEQFGGGGGIANTGTLSIDNVTISNNWAADKGSTVGGGIDNFGAGTSLDPGVVTLTNSTVSGNTAGRGGAINNTGSGSMTISNTTISDNVTYGDGAGGIFNSARLTVRSSTISGNSANSGYGGGLYHHSGTTALTDSTVSGNVAWKVGGGIYSRSGTLELADCTLSGNSNSYSTFGGGISIGFRYSDSVTVTGTTLTGTASSTGSGIGVGNYGTFRLEDSIVTGYSNGSGIKNFGALTVSNSTVSNNSSSEFSEGGGISNHLNGHLTLTDSMISDNSATHDGGGILNQGEAQVTSSTISDNSATRGGGIFTGHGTGFPGSMTLTNSTLSGNAATASGGGLYNWFKDATLINSTVSGNSAASGGGIYNYFYEYWSGEYRGGTVTLIGSLVGHSTPDNCNNAPAPLLIDLGLNLADDTTCVTIPGTLTGLSPTLADNGGPTKTHALLDGSTAIDAAGNCSLGFDQRGACRLFPCDSGSFEHLGCPLLQLENQVITTEQTFNTCSTAFLGPRLVIDPPAGKLTVRAGCIIAVHDETLVTSGRGMDLGIDTSLLPP